MAKKLWWFVFPVGIDVSFFPIPIRILSSLHAHHITHLPFTIPSIRTPKIAG